MLLLTEIQIQINIKGSIQGKMSQNDSLKGFFKEQGLAQPLDLRRSALYLCLEQ